MSLTLTPVVTISGNAIVASEQLVCSENLVCGESGLSLEPVNPK